MGFLVVEKKVTTTEKELKRQKRSYQKIGIKKLTGLSLIKYRQILEKLGVLKRYKSISGRKTEFSRIAHLKDSNIEMYQEECKKLCKDIKGISYNIKSKGFIVKKSINGKKIYGGVFDSFDNALICLNKIILDN